MKDKNVPQKIRQFLQKNNNWIDGIMADDTVKFANAYLLVIKNLIVDSQFTVKSLKKRKRILVMFMYTAIGFGAITGICAGIIYGISKSRGGATNENEAFYSLILSIFTGLFVFIGGSGKIIMEFVNFDEKISDLKSEIRLLEIIKNDIRLRLASDDVASLGFYAKSTDYFSTMENVVFGAGAVDDPNVGTFRTPNPYFVEE